MTHCLAGTFEDVFAAVQTGDAELAMIPVENSIAGRVADIHHLLPESNLKMLAEHFQPIRFHLMAKPGVKIGDLTEAHSHIMALGQCRSFLRSLKIEAVTTADTAGAAREVAESDRNRHRRYRARTGGWSLWPRDPRAEHRRPRP